MNVSAPALVPDLAGLALLLALPPGAAMKSSGFAPSPSPGAGAGTSPSFQAALHDLLPGKDEAETKPAAPEQQSEAKTALTVPVTVPVLSEPLPFRLAMPVQYAIAASQVAPQPVIASSEIAPQSGIPTALANSKRAASRPVPADGSRIASTKIVSGKSDSHITRIEVEPQVAVLTAAPPNAAPAGRPQPVQAVDTGPVGPATAPQPPAGKLPAAADGLPDVTPLRAAPVVAGDLNAPSVPDIAFTARLTPMPAIAPTVAADTAMSAPVTVSAGSASALAEHRIPLSPASADTAQAVAEPASEPVPAVHDSVTPGGPAKFAASDHSADRRSQGESPERPDKTEAAPADPPSHVDPASEKAAVHLESSAPVTATATESHAPAAGSAQQPDSPQGSDLASAAPAPNPHPAETHNISLRVADSGDHPVELKLTDRGGEVHVSVRTQDPELAGSLRENLGDLVHKLEQSGFRAETCHAAQPASMDSNSQQGRPNNDSFPGGRQQQQSQQQPQGRGRDQQESRQARWAQEMESSFAPESERSEFPWPAA